MAEPKKLNRRQEEFVRHYLLDLNASAAYVRAGFRARGNSAEVSAARLLRNAQVAEAIERAMAERSERTKIDAERPARTRQDRLFRPEKGPQRRRFNETDFRTRR